MRGGAQKKLGEWGNSSKKPIAKATWILGDFQTSVVGCCQIILFGAPRLTGAGWFEIQSSKQTPGILTSRRGQAESESIEMSSKDPAPGLVASDPDPEPGPSTAIAAADSSHMQSDISQEQGSPAQDTASIGSNDTATRSRSPRFLRWFKRGGSKPKPVPLPVVNKNRRLLVDYKAIKEQPLDHVYVEPLPSNILELHYVLRGPSGTPYEGGLYHGRLEFPQDFPFRPPAVYMITPNGRFRPNFRLCLSISDYHPDTWDPTWSCGTIIEGILSFMVEKTNTLGAIDSTLDEKRFYAHASYEFNLQDKVFCELFPELVDEINRELPNRAEEIAAYKKAFEEQNQSPLAAFFTRYRAFMRRAFKRKNKDKDKD